MQYIFPLYFENKYFYNVQFQENKIFNVVDEYYKLERCLKKCKQCRQVKFNINCKEIICEQCRYVKFKGTCKMARTKTNTQNNTRTRRTARRNRHLEEKKTELYK